MTTFNIDLSVITPGPKDVIFARIDTKDLPYNSVDDFDDLMFQLANAFPNNKIVMMSLNDEILAKETFSKAKCPNCGESFCVHLLPITRSYGD